MPTGYTYAALEKRMNLQQFAEQCMRAFGVAVHMRDEPLDVLLPETLKPDDYYQKAAEEARAELETLNAVPEAERIKRGKAEIEKEKAEAKKSHEKWASENAYFKNLLKEAEAWQEPTPDHREFKEFMVNQLKMSIDNFESYHEERMKKLEEADPLEYFNREITQAKDWLKSRLEDKEKNEERTRTNNEWIREIRNTFDSKPPKQYGLR